MPILGEKARAASEECIARGQELEDRGDLDGAEARFREAVAAAPDYPRASLNLGNALQKQGRLEEAAGAYEAALALDARYAGAHFNLGKVLLALARGDEAAERFERTLALDPAMADAAVMLGAVAESRGDLEGARTALERALRIAPGHAGAAVNLGTVLMEAGDATAARGAFRRALENDPRSAAALAGLARLDVQAGHAREADGAFRAALAIDADDPAIWSAFLFSLNFRDDLDARAIAREHFAFGRAFASRAPRMPLPDTRNRRVRVGYVSGDFMKHPIALFLAPVLEAHDRDAFEVFCYSNGGADDEVTGKLRANAEHWRDIHGREDPWAQALVRADGIDVLVDLSGHTARNRLGLFARRSAPVQATWLGYLNTSGLDSMDYRICDRFTDPEGETEELDRERLARLPASQWCYAPYYDIAANPRAPRAGAPVTFGSFNQFPKLGDACLDLWGEILRRVPDARLRVHGAPDGVRDDFLARLERRGVARARVSLTGRLGIREYFAAIEAVDIALDAMPYNGATTTLDTLWMGVPVVALRGDRPIARGTYSIVSAAGLPSLATTTPGDYVERNVRLAKDIEGRQALLRTLRASLEGSALMDSARFARDLESLYRRMCDSRIG